MINELVEADPTREHNSFPVIVVIELVMSVIVGETEVYLTVLT